jgi:glycosyltransferase involved in cell wall biosynthesis
MVDDQKYRYKLLILGDGSQFDDIAKYVKNNGMQNKIELLGYQKDPYKYLEAADVYVSSSRYEGLPLSALEAQSMGLPVIGFSVTGLKDIIDNNKNGLLIEDMEIESLAGLIVESFIRIDDLKTFGKRGIRLVRDKFAINDTASEYVKVYRELLKGRIASG